MMHGLVSGFLIVLVLGFENASRANAERLGSALGLRFRTGLRMRVRVRVRVGSVFNEI